MKRVNVVVVLVASVLLFALAACGGGEEAATEAIGVASASAAPAKADEAPASKGTPIDNSKFSTIMPDGWKVHADDIEKMGMMTIVYGTKYEGVYFKFEGTGRSMDSLRKQLTDFAEDREGSAPVDVTVNDKVWISTTYDFGGKQSMMVTDHNGVKVTLTIVGDGYGEHPGVTSVIDNLVLK
jgi:hypothetical protein